MVKRHDLDDREGTGNVCWVQADLRVPSEAIAGAEKVGAGVCVCVCHVGRGTPLPCTVRDIQYSILGIIRSTGRLPSGQTSAPGASRVYSDVVWSDLLRHIS